MAVRFDSFSLSEMTAKPEDAFRLASLAMVEGQRIQGYGGDYYRYYMGDAMVVVRTMLDPDSGEELLLGMDTHAASRCQWTAPPAGPGGERGGQRGGGRAVRGRAAGH